MKRTTIYLSDDLHKRFKMCVVREGRNMSTVFRDMIEVYLGKNRTETVAVAEIKTESVVETKELKEEVNPPVRKFRWYQEGK